MNHGSDKHRAMTVAILSEMWAKAGYDSVKSLPLQAFSAAAMKVAEIVEPKTDE